MLVFDLPVDQLPHYRGRNPRPADFDEYWINALAELDTVNLEVSFEPVAHPTPAADAYDLHFNGVGGGRIYAKYLRPQQPEPHPGVALFHGYSGRSPDWFDLIPYAAQGFAVLAMDCRGQGGRSVDVGGVVGNTLQGHIIRGLDGRPEDLLYRSIYLDTVAATRVLAARPEVDGERIGTVGASQGGGLSLACAALSPQVKAAASVYPFLCDFQRVWELGLADEAYVELRQYLRRFDPTHARVAETFTRLGYIDVQHLAPRINAAVLMFTGLEDMICPPSTQFAAYNAIPGVKEVVCYPDYAHEGLPGANDRILAFLSEALNVQHSSAGAG
jgi:cephalosporin-C deacetylase